MAGTTAKVTAGVGAAVALAGAAVLLTTSSPAKPGACVNVLTGVCQPIVGETCPPNFRAVISCEDRTPVEMPTPVPTPVSEAGYCYRVQSGECWPASVFPGGKCPLGTVAVTNCAPPSPTAVPVPTLPVPPISGTPAPFPTPRPTIPITWPPGTQCVGTMQLIQSQAGTLLIVDGVVIRTWGMPGQASKWQTTFSWTAVPLISGGN